MVIWTHVLFILLVFTCVDNYRKSPPGPVTKHHTGMMYRAFMGISIYLAKVVPNMYVHLTMPLISGPAS